jgi:hypothetical protein
MKLHYFLVILGLFYINSAQADIYKRVDADGHVTYSNSPLKGAKKLNLPPLPTVPGRAQRNGSPADFPLVDSVTQKGRDNNRKQILDDELATEEKALIDARAKLQANSENLEVFSGNDEKSTRNAAKQDDRMNALQEQVQMHEKNIAALKVELSKISNSK